jgi:hypothetical protein
MKTTTIEELGKKLARLRRLREGMVSLRNSAARAISAYNREINATQGALVAAHRRAEREARQAARLTPGRLSVGERRQSAFATGARQGSGRALGNAPTTA